MKVHFGSVSERVRLSWHEGTVGYGQANRSPQDGLEAERGNATIVVPSSVLSEHPAGSVAPHTFRGLFSIICRNVLGYTTDVPPPPR